MMLLQTPAYDAQLISGDEDPFLTYGSMEGSLKRPGILATKVNQAPLP
jgi:hypothetical protein